MTAATKPAVVMKGCTRRVRLGILIESSWRVTTSRRVWKSARSNLTIQEGQAVKADLQNKSW